MLPGPTPEHSRRRTELTRLFLAWGQAPRFLRNAAISLPTFLLDLGMLFLLVRRAHLDYLVATVISFLAANSLSYFLARWLVFHGTKRGLRAGLIYFLVIAALSMVAVSILMWLSVGVFHFDVILSRIGAAGIVGIGGYLLNLMVNFRVARTGGAPPRLSFRRTGREEPAEQQNRASAPPPRPQPARSPASSPSKPSESPFLGTAARRWCGRSGSNRHSVTRTGF
ncbi:MAG: GtrA family protein [Caulobacteraceae bacterium]